ncbi:type II/IV secretion system ATPase subunit [Candidatus Nitrosotenuis sp. DW1]|uniref:type II/IV secretion system ATPase subunit n=1 Tax=Candidatus Nitrosotenuis sp. DW1 TaxID=2259672 RepID=UPI0015CCDBE8|nr:ATPase, T2SS/T4P/T4SS family [Candidatus Nitrosotenuis sp. DW1]
MISEPVLNTESHTVYSNMMQQLFLSMEPMMKNDDPVNYIEKHLWEEANQQGITEIVSKNFNQLKYYLIRDVLGYGILDVLMKDKKLEEITVERFDRNVGIIHRQFSEFNILDTNVIFGTVELMNSYIQKLMQKTGNSVSSATPIVNTMTPEGHRIIATYEREVSLPGPTLDIRKFAEEPYTIVHLLKCGALNDLMAAYLWLLLDAKSFGLIVGETGSGKTTLLNTLIGLANPRWKIVTIEETPELQIPHYRWQRLFTRTSPTITQNTKFDISIMDLIKASMRMRPDFEIVGEVRGEEAQYLFQSAATGHGGLTTFHSSGAESALNRLAAEPINIKMSQQMLLWFIVHVTRLRTHEKKIIRQIISLDEITSQNNNIQLTKVFQYDIKSKKYNINSIDELIQKSKRIQHASDMLNVNLKEDLEKRILLLSECVQKNIKNQNQINLIISKYYDDFINFTLV